MHKYEFIDNGLLSPFFNTYLIQPILKKLPQSAIPNLSSLLSFAFSTLGLVSTLYFGHSWNGVMFTALFQFLYVISNRLNLAHLQSDTQTQSALRNFLTEFQNIYAVGSVHFTVFCFFEIATPFILIFSLTLNYLYLSRRYHQLHETGVMVLPKIGAWEQTLAVKAGYFLSLYPQAHEILVHWMHTILLVSVGLNILNYKDEIITAIKEKWQFGIYLVLIVSFHYFLPDYYIHHITLFIVLYNLHFIGSLIAARLTSSSYPLPDILAPFVLMICPTGVLTYGLVVSYLAARVCCLFFKTVAQLQSIPRDKDS